MSETDDENLSLWSVVPIRDLAGALVVGGAIVGASRLGLFGNETPLPRWAALVPVACVLLIAVGQVLLGLVLLTLMGRKK